VRDIGLVSDWDSDRLAWRLTDAQYQQYLRRLHAYYQRQIEQSADEVERLDRLAGLFRWLTIGCAVVVLVSPIVGGAR